MKSLLIYIFTSLPIITPCRLVFGFIWPIQPIFSAFVSESFCLPAKLCSSSNSFVHATLVSLLVLFLEPLLSGQWTPLIPFLHPVFGHSVCVVCIFCIVLTPHDLYSVCICPIRVLFPTCQLCRSYGLALVVSYFNLNVRCLLHLRGRCLIRPNHKGRWDALA